MRTVSGPAGGRTQDEPGSKRRCQMATSVSVRLAQDRGGGGAGCSPASAPAITVISTDRPSASVATTRGMSSSHSIEKWGSTSLSSPGRFSQIWNSSVGLSASSSTRGNISAWTMPPPAVSHWTSPRPKRAVAPRESEWST